MWEAEDENNRQSYFGLKRSILSKKINDVHNSLDELLNRYYIHNEIPCIKSKDYKVTLKQENNTNNEVNFVIDNELITVEDDVNEFENIQTGKFIKLFLDENVSFPIVCELINMSGNLINKKIYWSNDVIINTSNVSAGIYILRVRTYDNTMVKTKKLYIDNYN